MPLAIGYVLRGGSDFAGENVLIAAARPRLVRLRAERRTGELPARLRSGASGSGPR